MSWLVKMAAEFGTFRPKKLHFTHVSSEVNTEIIGYWGGGGNGAAWGGKTRVAKEERVRSFGYICNTRVFNWDQASTCPTLGISWESYIVWKRQGCWKRLKTAGEEEDQTMWWTDSLKETPAEMGRCRWEDGTFWRSVIHRVAISWRCHNGT